MNIINFHAITLFFSFLNHTIGLNGIDIVFFIATVKSRGGHKSHVYFNFKITATGFQNNLKKTMKFHESSDSNVLLLSLGPPHFRIYLEYRDGTKEICTVCLQQVPQY